ncbi:MAG: tetratricopeptide repeat protein [Candidatus Binatia bacterium]
MKAKKTSRRIPAVSRTAPVTGHLSAPQLQTFLSGWRMLAEPRVFQSIVIAVTFLVFLPVLNNGFVDSDRRLLVENLGYRGLGWAQLQWMFTAFHFGQFHPVAWLSLGINHVFWWTDPFGYHLINLSVHIVNAVIFYHIAVALFVHWQRADSYPGAKWFGLPAAVAALSFALHPLRVESVAWASTRGELIAAMFFLLSLLTYLKAKAGAAAGVMSAAWRFASLGTFLLSLLAGPSGFFLPAVLAIMHHYAGRGEGSPKSDMAGSAGRSLRYHLPYILLSGAYAVVAVIAGRYDDPSPGTVHRSNVLYWALDQLAAPALYLWNALLPIGLTPAYELTASSMAVFIAASMVLGALAVVLRQKWPALVPLWLCYVLLLLPVFRDGFPVEQVFADRFTYLAALPWALLIGACAARALYVVAVRGMRTAVLISCASILVAGLTTLGVLTWRQIPLWQDAETLWRNAAAVNPTSSAYYNLARLSESQGNYGDAVASYRRVVELNPEHWDAHERAGALLYKQGKMAEALEHYRVFVQFNPNSIEARENLATALVNQAQPREAVEHLRKLIQLSPEANRVRVKLGTILAVEGRLDEAAEVLAVAAKQEPKDGRILLQLGRILAAQGKLDNAIVHFREAAKLLHNDAEAQESLGRGLLEVGRKDEGAKHLAEAVRILRSSPTAR